MSKSLILLISILKIRPRKFNLFTELSVLSFPFAQWVFTTCLVSVALFHLPGTVLGSWRNQSNWNTNTSHQVTENTCRNIQNVNMKQKMSKTINTQGLHCVAQRTGGTERHLRKEKRNRAGISWKVTASYFGASTLCQFIVCEAQFCSLYLKH